MDFEGAKFKERLEVSSLLDLYGELLTEKQRSIMNLYYNEDYSLSEIAEINNTSRQAIYDLTKRCLKILLNYENKLEFLKQSRLFKSRKKDMLNIIDEMEHNLNDKDYDSLKKCILELKKIILE